MVIDFEKFIASLIIGDKNMYSSKSSSEWIENALKEQGLVFKGGGKFVSINE